MNKFLYAGGGAVLGALLVFVIAQTQMNKDTSGVSKTEEVALESDSADEAVQAPQALPPQAFGDLGNSAQPQMGGRGMGGGGGPSMPMATDAVATMDSKMMAPDTMIYPYNPVVVDYIYDGEIALPEGDVTVYRRKPGAMLGNASALNGTFASELFDVSKVSGLKMQSVNLVQSGKEGYAVYVDFQNGTVSINKQIDYSARPESRCMDEKCFSQYRLKQSDMPADSEVIAMANDFLKDFGIDTSDYGAPSMMDDWRYWYETATDKAAYWFPEQLSVTYPYLIEGKSVYDEWGNPVGLSVSVDVRTKQVVGVWGLQTMNYDTSSYAAVSDVENFKAILKQGGVNQWRDPNAKVVEAPLGAPVEAFVQIYRWDDSNYMGDTLFVPALAFPVESMPMESNMVRKSVVLPLAEDLLKSTIDPNVRPLPMPLMEKPMPIEEGIGN